VAKAGCAIVSDLATPKNDRLLAKRAKNGTLSEAILVNSSSPTLLMSPNPVIPIQIKTILVPLDFSRASMDALDYAVSVAKQFHAAIHLVHVHPPDELSSVPGAGHLLLQSAEAVEFLNKQLAKIHRKRVPGFSPENCHVRGGRPYQEILELAREIDADLIIVSTRGRTGLTRVLLGSTAERVVRSTPCPVIVVRKRKQKPKAAGEAFAIRTILVPVDFSECSLAGVQYAAFLAKTLGAKLRLFHAMYPYADYVIADPVGARLVPLIEAEQAAAREEMEQLKRIDFLRDVSLQTEIRTGHAIEEICHAARQPDIDVVVTSTHGRTGLKHALIGSVAEHVVRYAECPVIVVPSQCALRSK
jgi:nucleotide-binding universal stress UspA family protein